MPNKFESSPSDWPLSKPNRGRKSPKKTTFWCNCDFDTVKLVGKGRKCSHCGADFGKERKLHKVEPAAVSLLR